MYQKHKSLVGIVAFSFFLTSMTFIPQDSFAAVKRMKRSKRDPIVIISSIISRKNVNPAPSSSSQYVFKEKTFDKLPFIAEFSVETSSGAVTIFDDSKKPISKVYQKDPASDMSKGERKGESTGGGEGGLGGQGGGGGEGRDGSPLTGGVGGFYLMETLPYNKYVNPSSPQVQFTLKVGQYTGTQLTQFLNAGYTLEAYISNGLILGNNPWRGTLANFTRVPLNSGIVTLNLSNQPQGVPIYIFFAGRSPDPANHVITTTAFLEVQLLNFPNNDPQSYVGVLGGAMERTEDKAYREAIVPVTPQQADDLAAGTIKFVVYDRANNKVEPVQISNWTYEGGKIHEVKLGFLNTGEPEEAPEYFEREIHVVPASQAQDPQFMTTPGAQNFLTNGQITITVPGPRSGEIYSKNFPVSSCTYIPNFSGSFEKTYRCGGALIPPTGRTDLLPNGPVVDLVVNLLSGENYATFSFSIHNSVVGMNFSDTKSDHFYFKRMEAAVQTQAGPAVTGIYAYKWPIPWENDTFEQYGTPTISGNVARIDFITPLSNGRNHWLRKDQSYLLPSKMHVAFSQDPSDLNRVEDASRNLSIMLTMNDNTYNASNTNSYFKIPSRTMGISDLRRVMSENQIRSEMMSTLADIWTNSWGMVRLPENFVDFTGSPSGGATSGVDIAATSKIATYAHNARNLNEINDAIRTMKYMALAAFSRQQASTLVKEDGTSNSLAFMLDRGIAPFLYYNAEIHPASPYQSIFSLSSSQNIRDRHAAHAAAATSNLAAYASTYLLPENNYRGIDWQHKWRFNTPVLAAETLAILQIRHAIEKWGNAEIVGFHVGPNNSWGFQNTVGLHSMIASTPQNLGLCAMGRNGEALGMAIKRLYLDPVPSFIDKTQFIDLVAILLQKASRPDGLLGESADYVASHMNPSVYAGYQQLAASLWGGTASQYSGGKVVVQWQAMLALSTAVGFISLYENHPDASLRNDAADIKDVLVRFTRAIYNPAVGYNPSQNTPAWTIMNDMIRDGNRYSFYPSHTIAQSNHSYVFPPINQYSKEVTASGLVYMSYEDRMSILPAFPSEFFYWNGLAMDEQGLSLLWVMQKILGLAP